MMISSAKRRGFALIVVMLVVVSLGMLAFGFAYSMKVETELARNASVESELEWIGRSGIELTRWILALETQGPTTLTQVWAGVPAFEGPLAEIGKTVKVGRGEFTWTIVDQDSKFNINAANPVILREAMLNIGLEATDTDLVVDGILDWLDPDDMERLSGAESDYYTNLDPPYFAKNGPMDDLSELLLIRGITPALYLGGSTDALGLAPGIFNFSSPLEMPKEGFAIGLRELFTTISGPRINLNTAPASTLTLIPFVEEQVASEIIAFRQENPFSNVGQVGAVVPPEAVQFLQQYVGVDSEVFEATIEARIGDRHRTYVAMLHRPANSQVVNMLYMHWK